MASYCVMACVRGGDERTGDCFLHNDQAVLFCSLTLKPIDLSHFEADDVALTKPLLRSI